MNQSVMPEKIFFRDQELSFSQALGKLNNNSIAINLIINEFTKRIILEENFAKEGVEELSQEDQDKLFNNFKQQTGLQTEEQEQQFWENSKTTKEELLNVLSYNERINRLKDILITPDKIKETFIQSKPRNEQISFSLIRVEGQEQAENVYNMITQEFADFMEMARMHSVDQSAPQGAVVGPLPIAGVHPNLIQVLLNLKVGEVSQPIPSDDGTYIIAKLINYSHVSLTSALAQNIQNDLFEQWVAEQIKMAEPSVG